MYLASYPNKQSQKSFIAQITLCFGTIRLQFHNFECHLTLKTRFNMNQLYTSH